MSDSTNEDDTLFEGPVFEMDLHGYMSRVRMDGRDLPGVMSVTVNQPLTDAPVVTITFRAGRVKGIKD